MFMKFIRKLLNLNKPEIIILVGAPGSGKSTYAKTLINHTRISQDDQGKNDHVTNFYNAVSKKENIVIDRMNFDRKQRGRYLNTAKSAGYKTRIIVIETDLETCIKRCNLRQDHPTIRDAETAVKVNLFFIEKYETPLLTEADVVEFIV